MDRRAFVHVVDDDEPFRLALDNLFRSVGLECGLHESVDGFLAAAKPDIESCLVLDVRMPGISGLDFLDRLDGLGINIPVVMMTGHGDIPMTVRAMKAGAVDFLPKPFREQDMLDAVSAAIQRDRDRRAAADQSRELENRLATLSPREREVMLLVTKGLLNKQVAGDLGLSEITVKIHRGAAMRKMGARTLADLIHMATALGLEARATD